MELYRAYTKTLERSAKILHQFIVLVERCRAAGLLAAFRSLAL